MGWALLIRSLRKVHSLRVKRCAASSIDYKRSPPTCVVCALAAVARMRVRRIRDAVGLARGLTPLRRGLFSLLAHT